VRLSDKVLFALGVGLLPASGATFLAARARTSQLSPQIDTQPPIIQFLSPSRENATITPDADGLIHFRARVTDNVALRSVAFYVPGADSPLYTLLNQDFDMRAVWDVGTDAPEGKYKVKCVAIDTSGNKTVRVLHFHLKERATPDRIARRTPNAPGGFRTRLGDG